MKKRGTIEPSGASAASVVALLTLLLVFYILFLPPEERQRLLEGENVTGKIPVSAERPKVLLLANIGTLEFFGQNEVEHTIPNLLLTETSSAAVLQSFNTFVVTKSLFSEKPRAVEFQLQNVQALQNVKLVFQAPESSGTLLIKLNGIALFEGSVSAVLAPIEIPAAQLRERNTLEFSVSSPGIAFWRTNSVQVDGLQLIADVKDIARQSSYNVFTVDREEKQLFNKATLSFFAVCQQQQVSSLEVRMNSRTAYNSVPDCDTLNRFELFGDYLQEGQNTLEFTAARGTYRIEQIKIKTGLKEPKPFVQFFELNTTEYNKTAGKNQKLILQLEFVDDNKDKQAEININGLLVFLDQKEKTFRRDISINAREGNNYIEIKPKSTLHIVKLEVKLE